MWTTPPPREAQREARRRPGVPPTPGQADIEEADPAEFADDASADSTDHASAAEARLLEAFPGASEVAG